MIYGSINSNKLSKYAIKYCYNKLKTGIIIFNFSTTKICIFNVNN